jgi:HlyD family secretion protein
VKNIKKFWWVILIGFLVLIFVIKKANTPPPVFETAKVSKGEIVETVSSSGLVLADKYANLTFQSSGRVAWVNVHEGQKVVKGQAIAGLDTTILNSAYQQALNNYRNYQASSENTLDIVKGHSADETFAQKALRTTAEVNRDNAYDAVTAAHEALRNANLYAPFAGIVATVTPSFPGSNVTPASASYVIVNPDTVYFDGEIEETDLPRLKVGQDVNIKLDAYPEETFTGKIETIGFVAFTSSTGGNAYKIRITLPENVDMKFRYGMQGDIDIITNKIENVIKVETSAIVNKDSKNFVWVVENEKVKQTEVTLGASSNDETEIKSGLSENQIVISNPTNKLKDGQKIMAND